MAQFRVLGALEVDVGEKTWQLTAPKQRQVLCQLILSVNQIVNVDSLIADLWGSRPPKSAMTTTQTYIYQLRKTLGRDGGDPGADDLLVTRPPGYILCVDPENIDAFVFRRLVREGRDRLARGAPEGAARKFRQALDLWSGPPLAGVTLGCVLEAHQVNLEEQRLRALELRIVADLQRGKGRELIGELRFLVASNPLNEWFHGQLMIALSQVGRRNESLQVYQDLRSNLDQELGLDPSEELRRLQYQVLNGQASRAAVSPPAVAAASA